MKLTPDDFLERTDFTLLKPEATRADFEKLAREAKRLGFKRVCVPSSKVEPMTRLLAGSSIQICAVVGFPHGNASSPAKAQEAMMAVRQGAVEIDMVSDIGALRSGDVNTFGEDVRAVVRGARSAGDPIVKVILGTDYLTADEIRQGCLATKEEAGVGFVETCTGFGPGGATTEHVALMAATVNGRCGVKASGKLRTWQDVEGMAAAGATRFGIGADGAMAIYESARSASTRGMQ